MAENDFSINDAPTMKPAPISGGRRLVAGDTILGRYAVVRELGEGGMGVVYQCLDKVGGVSVAVKCLPPEVSRNADEMEDIRANYRLVADLHHPNIAGARTLELDGSTGDYYLVMDLAAGMTLKRWARRHPDAGLDAKLAILRQVAAALDYAHARKVIHRDVKPENVMVDDEGGVKVLDFGLAAQIRSSQSRTSNTVTSKGGTPGYKSPEQWLGRPQREPADVYSFGVMAYWLFSGHLPFDGDDPVVLGHAVLSAPVGPIHDLPAHMNAALVKALAKAPEDRFSSCIAFVDALEGKVGSRVPRDRMGGPRSRAAVKGIIAAALLAALAGGGYYGWTKYDEGVKAREAQYAEERARLEKANEERIARLEAEKRRIEAEREKREKELAEERARLEKERTTSAKQETATELTLAEQEARQKEVARLAELRVDIGIKCDDAKEKMGRLAAYRGEPDGFKAHIDNADANWKIVEAVERNPETVSEAEKSLNSVTAAENAIAKDLHWLSTNKTARDGAKATEAEIARAIDPELKRFKADDYARVVFTAGDRLRKEGNAALSNGDFSTAKKKLEEAKAKLSKAAANAKKFCIDTHLNAAKKWIAASRWQQCVEECDTVLGWDSDNAEAKRLKAEAEGHLVPMAKVVATIDGREVSGAKLDDGTKIHTTPINWKLEDGKKYGPYNVSYEIDGKQYYGTFDAVTIDWRGPREFTIALKEYTGPKAGDTKPFTLPGGVEMEMVYVAPGSFTMGSSSGASDETPHQVRITKPYWIGKYPVTQAQWKALVKANGVSFEKGEPTPYFSRDGKGTDIVGGMDTSDFPIEGISWNDCDALVKVLNRNASDGRTYSLPTEAQWEFAARGGTKSRGYTYSGGNEMDTLGWYYENSGVRRLSDSDWKFENLASNKCRTHSVMEKDVGNELGIVGMSGNVWEWCLDWYDKDYYTESPTEDPCNTASGDRRVLRGGGWLNSARSCRSADRLRCDPGNRRDSCGFRLCCSAGPRGGAEQ